MPKTLLFSFVRFVHENLPFFFRFKFLHSKATNPIIDNSFVFFLCSLFIIWKSFFYVIYFCSFFFSFHTNRSVSQQNWYYHFISLIFVSVQIVSFYLIEITNEFEFPNLKKKDFFFVYNFKFLYVKNMIRKKREGTNGDFRYKFFCFYCCR